MKKFTVIIAFIFSTNIMLGQFNKIDTSFFSESLQETKMVDIYFPPGYDTSNWYYPVIYYLHGWTGSQNTISEMLTYLETLINSGTISPLIMVSADNSPDPFEGSMYVNSELWGDYEDYMTIDLIEWIESSFRVVPNDRNYRALLGQSMGAYGAFRYGIYHKDKYKVLAAHAGIVSFDKSLWLDTCRQMVVSENQPGPTFFYDYYTDGVFTRGTFLMSGAFSPNSSSTQAYINPQNVDYLFDDSCNYIEPTLEEWQPYDIMQHIDQIEQEDSVGIYFGCGTNDNFLLYQSHLALKDTLDSLTLPNEFYSHTGNHNMPTGFKEGALIFIDSLLLPACPMPGLSENTTDSFLINLIAYPNPVKNSVNVRLGLKSPSYLELYIANLQGQNVKTLFKGEKSTGSHYFSTNLKCLTPGIYFLYLRTDNIIETRKLVIL